VLPKEKAFIGFEKTNTTTNLIIITLIIFVAAGVVLFIVYKKIKDGEKTLVCDICHTVYLKNSDEYKELILIGECPICQKNR
jgi:hypothetical protein